MPAARPAGRTPVPGGSPRDVSPGALGPAVAFLLAPVLAAAGCTEGPGLPVGTGGADGEGPVAAWGQVAAGDRFSCGLAADGRAFCWGTRRGGALGDGATAGDSPVPVRVEADLRSDLRFDTLVAGRGHACGLTGAGEAWCWGDSGAGQVGAASPERCRAGASRFVCSSRPRRAAGSLTFASLAAGGEHTCGVTGGGVLACWGSNEAGQLGQGVLGGGGAAPVAVRGFVFRSVAAGGFHTCGLTGGGDVLCWGANRFGQLGDRSRLLSTFPASVTIRGGEALAAGTHHTCVLAPAHCWGRGDAGQLGAGVPGGAPFPVRVSGDAEFRQLAAGDAHTCGIAAGGDGLCWGRGDAGALGTGSAPDVRSAPTPVEGGRRWRDLAAGRDHSCGVTEGGRAFCWGANGSGQLGDGTREARAMPVEVAPPR